jgi:hypothetical protein
VLESWKTAVTRIRRLWFAMLVVAWHAAVADENIVELLLAVLHAVALLAEIALIVYTAATTRPNLLPRTPCPFSFAMETV